MITIAAGARILLATRPVDFRRGGHSLAALAQEVLGEDPFSGAVIVYRAKRSDRVKILVWDSSGLVLIWKQLQHGSFRWPPIMDGVMTLSAVGFAALFDGLDWTRGQTVRGFPNPPRRLRILCVMDVPREPLPSLPDDAAALRALVLAALVERDVVAGERDALANERDAAVTERDALLAQNDRLRHLLLKLTRMQFGARSERRPEGKPQLGLGAAGPGDAQVVAPRG